MLYHLFKKEVAMHGANLRARLVHLSYNLLIPIALLLGVLPWLLKMYRRGGLSQHLWQRLGFYQEEAEYENLGAVYVHAVSVGEVMLALKLINKWSGLYPEERFILVPTTSTGYDLAIAKAPAEVRVIYSPLDLPIVLRRVFKRFEPKQIVLMESELWPNLLVLANKLNIPVAVANARLSDRSEVRYQKLSCATGRYFGLFSKMAVQEEADFPRWRGIGVPESSMKVCGSVKFDQEGAVAHSAERNPSFAEMLGTLGSGKKIVMALSTHPGEDALIAEALKDVDNVFPVIIPRHAERRNEITAELGTLGFAVVLRSDFHSPATDKPRCFVVDSTGEMKDWITLADLAIIGKSLVGRGGQNPCEAIAAGVPVIVGPNMQNFEPLASRLHASNSIVLSEASVPSLRSTVLGLLDNAERQARLVDNARGALASHSGATTRTVEFLRLP